MNLDYSKLFNVNKSQIINSVVNAVVAAVVVGLGGIVTSAGFDIFHADWAMIIHQVINWGFAAFIGSLGKSLLTTDKGNVLGVVNVK